jgi:hypothetical protein
VSNHKKENEKIFFKKSFLAAASSHKNLRYLQIGVILSVFIKNIICINI